MTPLGTRLPDVTVDLDEVELLTHLAGIDELPVVLDASPRHDTAVARDAAFGTVRDALSARGLLPGGSVHPDVEDRLRVLARPDRELAVRRHSGGQVARLCVARAASMTVLALRGPRTLVLSEVTGNVSDVFLDVLGRTRPLETTVSAPTDLLTAVLADVSDPRSVARGLTDLGARDAEPLAAAFAACHAHTEIVAIVHRDGRRATSAPVTVFDTDAGRIVGTSSVAGDGTPWSTLGPGGDARLRDSVRDLLEWVPGAARHRPSPDGYR